MASIAPQFLAAVDKIAADKDLNEGVRMMRARRSEFSNLLEMKLAGIGMMPQSRRALNSAISALFAKQSIIAGSAASYYDEVIIGGGFHAAQYAIVRALKGYPRPLVIERRELGGQFAVSLQPVWWMNSRNRAGEGGLPSENAALNYMIGAPVQAAHLSSQEFQSNAEIAFVIRCALALFADVVPGEVTDVDESLVDGWNYKVSMTDDTGKRAVIQTQRVIDARGLGESYPTTPVGDRAMNFNQFMERMGRLFPLRGMKRVAVIGDGDSGKTVVEALLGVGPANSSTPALDWVEQVDWYGTSLPANCATWRDNERGRYQALGSFLNAPINGVARLRRIDQRGVWLESANGVLVNARRYDHVIICTGLRRNTTLLYGDSNTYAPNGRGSEEALGPIAKEFDFGAAYNYQIGPICNFGFVDSEYNLSPSYTNRTENRVALFRYMPGTATLAATLGRGR